MPALRIRTTPPPFRARRTSTESIANINTNSTTTFTITDSHGDLSHNRLISQLTPNPSFPALDSLTLNMKVTATNPNDTVFLVYANGVLLTPATWSGGFIDNPAANTPRPAAALPSATTTPSPFPSRTAISHCPPARYSSRSSTTAGMDHYLVSVAPPPCVQSNPSSANQVVNIIDDRTSADFSLQIRHNR